MSITIRQRRQCQLDVLSIRIDQTWDRIRQLPMFKQARPYDEAAALVQDLQDLAEYQGRLPIFKQQLISLKADYSNPPGFFRRFEERNL